MIVTAHTLCKELVRRLALLSQQSSEEEIAALSDCIQRIRALPPSLMEAISKDGFDLREELTKASNTMRQLLRLWQQQLEKAPPPLPRSPATPPPRLCDWSG